MKRSKFSEEPAAYALRQAESGTPVGDVCRQLRVSEPPSTPGKEVCTPSREELRRLRQLEDENNRLKRLVADLTLDKHAVRGLAKKA
jgi:putative transposase